MKFSKVLLLVATAATLVSGVALANDETPRADRREARQHERIREGMRSGQLTHREARHLMRGQRHVHRMEYRAKRDGRVTPRERARIQRAQNRQSRHIWQMKHNRRTQRGI